MAHELNGRGPGIHAGGDDVLDRGFVVDVQLESKESMKHVHVNTLPHSLTGIAYLSLMLVILRKISIIPSLFQSLQIVLYIIWRAYKW